MTIPLLIIVALIATQSGVQLYMAFKAYKANEYIHSRIDQLEEDFYEEDDNA